MERFVNIIKPILGDFISPVSVVILDNEQMETIRTSVSSFRPPKRLSKNIYTPYALLMNDNCFLAKDDKYPIIAVEIKPKQGFLCQQSNNNGQICNFCIKKNYLSKTGKDGGLKSKYCPLDLFSGNSRRMERAFESLMEIPKNNLRIFMDGSLLHDENSTENETCDAMIKEIFQSRYTFIRILIEILKSTSNSGELGINGHSHLKRETEVLSTREKHSCHEDNETLPKNCVLDKILDLQTCPTSDLEAENLVKNMTLRGIQQEEVEKIITRNITENYKSGDDGIRNDFSDEVVETISKLQEYCKSVTAKDLSIILTISQKDVKDKSEDSSQIVVIDKTYKYKLSIIDLDPKSLNKIPNYIKNKCLWSSV